jgi:hypothetical protein
MLEAQRPLAIIHHSDYAEATYYPLTNLLTQVCVFRRF